MKNGREEILLRKLQALGSRRVVENYSYKYGKEDSDGCHCTGNVSRHKQTLWTNELYEAL